MKNEIKLSQVEVLSKISLLCRQLKAEREEAKRKEIKKSLKAWNAQLDKF